MSALSDPIIPPSTSALSSTETLADLLHRLGGVSPARIRAHPAPGTASVADVAAIESRENRLFELIDGVLVEKVTGYWKSYWAVRIATALNIWVLPRNLGMVTGSDGMVQLFPKLVRIPDVAFASWARFPDGKPSKDAVPELVPDLAVEVLSESNTNAEMNRKRGGYFKAGVKLAWFVDGNARTAAVYTGAEEFVLLGEGDVLDGGAVLPGFTLALKELFAEVGK